MCEVKNKINKSSENSTETKTNMEADTKSSTDAKNIQPVNFEAALLETKFGKFNYFLIFIAGLVIANVILETLGIGFVHPVAQCDLKLTTNNKGLLSAIGFVGIITSSHLWGFLADTTGRKRVIQPTLFMGFIFTLISSFMNNFWVFLVLRFLNGFFISGGSATIYAYLGEFHTNKTRSRAIMGASVIFGFGCMLLPAIAWLIINQDWYFYVPFLNVVYKPWRLFMVACGLPGLFCAFCLFKFPESPKFTLAHNQNTETIEILKTVFTVNTGKPKSEYKITAVIDDTEDFTCSILSTDYVNPISKFLKSMWKQTAPLFQMQHIRKTMICCTLQFGIYVTSNGMYLWFPEILNQISEFKSMNTGIRTTICQVVYSNQFKISKNESNEFTDCNIKLEISTYQHSLLLEVMYAVGFAIFGFIINCVEKQKILFTTLVACGACGVAAVLVDIPLISIYLYIILLLCGIGTGVVNAATVDLFPTNLRAMAVCISLMMGRLGGIVGSTLIGFLLDSYCIEAFIFSGSSLIVCGFLALLIPKSSKQTIEISRRASMASITRF